MRLHGLFVRQEARVAKLVHLVVADKLVTDKVGGKGDIRGACRHRADSAAGKGYLGGGGEHEDPVLRSVPEAGLVDVGKLVPVAVVEVVHTVGVVPYQTEVRGRRLHRRQALDRLVGIGEAGGV